ncbi:ribonuclease R, partial [Lachnotalea glycerini]
RMTYTSVKKILEDKDVAEIEEYKELVPMFELMQELAQILREKRRKRGSIDFDFPESKIILDKLGKPLEIKPYERNVATKIIEDFMLAANETVAQDYFWQEMPFVYRVHDNPAPEKIQKLAMFITNFGYGIKTTQEEIHPKELQKLLQKIEDTPEEALISRLTLRSMK